MRDDLRTGTGRPVRAAWVALAGVTIIVVAGCGDTDRVSSPGPSSAAGAVADQPHTRFDVLFAFDIIDHSGQAVVLSNSTTVKQGIAPEIRDIARQISVSSTTYVNELQALLVDWGFTSMTGGPRPAADKPNVPVAAGEHPLAVDADVRRVTSATGAGAAGQYLELMIRQHRFTISAARDQLEAGSNPRAMAIARSLIESQQREISVMETLQP